MKISRAEPRDIPGILAIQKVAYLSEAALYPRLSLPPLQESEEELSRVFANPATVVLKAEIDSALAGSARARLGKDGVCLITRLSVDPRHQRRGIGNALLAACESAHPDAEICELFTGSKSEANLRLYQKRGFRIVRQKETSYGVTEVFLQKTLNPHSPMARP